MGVWFIVQDDHARYKQERVVFTSRGAIGGILFEGAFYFRSSF